MLQEEQDYLEAISERIRETSGITPVVETREGRVADKVLRAGDLPLLMMRPRSVAP